MTADPLPGARAPVRLRLAALGFRSIASIPPGYRIVGAALTVTTALWVVGRIRIAAGGLLLPFIGPGELVGDWSITLMSMILFATARSRMIEPLFGGLDRAVRLHRRLGPIAVLLVLVHAGLYLPPVVTHGGSVGDLLVPFWSANAQSFNSVMLYALLIWTGFAYMKWFRYEGWLSLHGMFGLIFLVASMHSLGHGRTVLRYEPLRFWMWLLILVGFASWAYRVILFRWVAPRYRYRVEAVQVRSADTADLLLRPHDRRMMYEPGTFVFISRPGWKRGRELHPFSISSSPAERLLRLSIRMLGDFTRTLPNFAPGEAVEVFGPFGGFTPHRHAPHRRIACIGLGIGVAPFLAMLRFETVNDDFRRMWLWYIVPDAADAPYDSEIRDGVEKADSFIDYELWVTRERGRLTAAEVTAAIEPFDDYAVMLCGGREFVADLARQFVALGLPRERVITEEFYFR